MKGNCQNCGKKGHYIGDCWANGSKEGQTPKWYKLPKEVDTAKQSNDNNFTFAANTIVYATTTASDWLADSVVTTHIVQD